MLGCYFVLLIMNLSRFCARSAHTHARANALAHTLALTHVAYLAPLAPAGP